ncbi:MAG: MBL fold metallo-hydrolase [Treponema sp.]
MEIKEIYTGELFVKTWIFMQDEKLVIVDPGGADEELLDYINEKKPKTIEIMLTHGHFDHVGGVPYLFKNYNVTKIYIHKNDSFYLGKGAKAKHIECFAPIRMERYIKAMNDEFPEASDYIDEGDVINGFTVFHTPGHTEGSVCYYKQDENILFSGDTLFRRSRGRTDLLEGNEEKLIHSLKRLITLPKDTTVYPGHGANTTILEEVAWIEKI